MSQEFTALPAVPSLAQAMPFAQGGVGAAFVDMRPTQLRALQHQLELLAATSAAAALIAKLAAEHKFALGGMFAILLGRKSPFWSEAFCRGHLHRLTRTMLHLAADQGEALTPFLDPEAPTAMLGWRPR